MARKSRSLLFVVLAILLQASALSVASAGISELIDPKDPNVVEIAKFAVTEHNKQGGLALVFQQVVKGKKLEVAGGFNYQLVIAAGYGTPVGVGQYYQALVFEQTSQKSRKLVYFQRISN